MITPYFPDFKPDANPPADANGSSVKQNPLKNGLKSSGDGHKQLSKTEQTRFFETRAMNIAPGASRERLRVMGWVEDEKGRVVAAAQSRCQAP